MPAGRLLERPNVVPRPDAFIKARSPLKPPPGFELEFVRALAHKPAVFGQDEALRLLAERLELLAAEKYGAASWLEERRSLTC